MHSKENKGFSLVELAIVLVIAGIVLAITTPGLIKYLNGQRVRDSAHVLADEFRMARQKAVTNGTRNYVYTQWGTGQAQFWRGVVTKTDENVWSGISWSGPYDLPDRTKQISANFGGYQYLYFDTNGRAYSPLATACSGSVRVCSTIPSVKDTTTINVDLSGAVW